MTPNRRALFGGLAAVGAAGALPATGGELASPGFGRIADGPFKPSWDSLNAGYKAPDWFRDAKFGLWAHWGAQCVPEAGDWYARNMYLPGQRAYDHHLKTYGHPADTGFIDFYPKWRAENWNPDDLLDLYARAGAKYFVAMANHHDNFDAYDSKFHDWNTVRLGPKKDIIGIWSKAARRRGLRFGVSNHSAHAWHWFQPAYGYDPEGPRKGERYDAFKLYAVDGKGKWWEGLDPQQLYGGPAMVMPDGVRTVAEADKWHEANDRAWTEKAPLNNPAFTRQWFLRCKDLIDSYKPDLVYFDNFDLPLEQAGLDIAAHFYNASRQWNDGRLEAVINIKPEHGRLVPGVVPDVERGLRSEISPIPWQTDTCIGSWHYDREIFENKRYLPAAEVVHRLCDIVSKNGNLLLSVPVRPDGTIDSEERRIVEEIGGWMGRFSDAIHGTRPWVIYGEGPTEVMSGMFNEAKQKSFTSADIRFTTKGRNLYAISLGAPRDGQVSVTSLAKGGPHARGAVRRVTLAGDNAPLAYRQDGTGLHVMVPERAVHPFGVALRIEGVL